MRPMFASACALALLVVVSGRADAAFLSGRILDTNGSGVFNVNFIIHDSATGQQVSVTGDNTDATGRFRFVINNGVYIVQMEPPFADRLGDAEVDNFVVNGDTDMGTITLPAGVVISGRVVDTNGFGVFDSNQISKNSFNGVQIPTHGDHADASGFFQFVVPPGTIDFEFKPPEATFLVGVRRDRMTIGGDTNLGSVTVAPGVQLSGRVVRSGGVPVASVSIGAVATFTGEDPPLTNHDSLADGTFAVIVPATQINLSLSPPQIERLAGKRVLGINALSNTNIGDVTLDAGNVLSGTINMPLGGGADHVDVNLYDSAGVFFPTRADNSDASGQYSVVGPKLSLDALITPPFDMDWKHQLITGQNLSFGDGALNVGLASTPVVLDLTLGAPGVVPGARFSYTFEIRNLSGSARNVLYSAEASVPGTTLVRTLLPATNLALGSGSGVVTVGPFQRRIPPMLRPRFKAIPIRITGRIVDPGTLEVLDFDIAHFVVF